MVFFCTSGGSSAGKAIEYARGKTKDADRICWLDDKLLNDCGEEDVAAWVANL